MISLAASPWGDALKEGHFPRLTLALYCRAHARALRVPVEESRHSTPAALA
jgi:hypothetical protein